MALIVRSPYHNLDGPTGYWAYCGLDTLGTRQAFDVLEPQLDEEDRVIYNSGLAFQSFCLAMTLRGCLVDEVARVEAIKLRTKEEIEAIAAINAYPLIQEKWTTLGKRPVGDKCAKAEKGRHLWEPRAEAPESQRCKYCDGPRLVGQAFNPHSPPQCMKLFYEILGFQKRYSKKGERKVTIDDDALEALALKNTDYAEFIDLFKSARAVRKQLGMLRSRLDSDGRWRATFNVDAAETGRMSSSKSPYRTGSNFQNIADKSRNIFVPDPGLELWYADLEQAESRIVAYDAECAEDIRDHEAGDVHTGLVKRLWPELWARAGVPLQYKGVTPEDKAVASQPTPWDPSHDYRHYGKIIRHGTNIGMSHVGIARSAHIKQPEARKMREGYFSAYPNLRARQQDIRQEVRSAGLLITPLGRKRRFLGRLWEEDTMKEGLAQTQQSTIADVLNLAAWRIWYEMDGQLNIGSAPKPSDPNRVWVLGQIHDAVLGLRRIGDDDALRRVKEIMETPVIVRGKYVKIPTEIVVGQTWRKKDMTKWEG